MTTSLFERINIPDKLAPYVNDYKINLFEIAFLSDEQVGMFKSDFRLIADYFVQMRKTGKYIPPTDAIKHVSELLGMMSALTNDRRFTEVYDEVKGKEKPTMCVVLDEVESRGEARGIEIGEARGKELGETRLSNLISALIKDNDNDAIAKVASDKKIREEYYKKYNL